MPTHRDLAQLPHSRRTPHGTDCFGELALEHASHARAVHAVHAV